MLIIQYHLNITDHLLTRNRLLNEDFHLFSEICWSNGARRKGVVAERAWRNIDCRKCQLWSKEAGNGREPKWKGDIEFLKGSKLQMKIRKRACVGACHLAHVTGKGHYVLEASKSFKDLLRSTTKFLLYLSAMNRSFLFTFFLALLSPIDTRSSPKDIRVIRKP